MTILLVLCALTQTLITFFFPTRMQLINQVECEAEVCDFVSLSDREEQELSPEHNPVSQG